MKTAITSCISYIIINMLMMYLLIIKFLLNLNVSLVSSRVL